ncbi:MAG: PAS domain-containing protein [Planctomycetes bacterium]|nr:PAS domain-containing protein [Planctomycetota bacterium]
MSLENIAINDDQMPEFCSHLGGLLSAAREMSTSRQAQGVMDVVRLTARELLQADGITFVLRENDSCYYAEENAISPLWKGKRFPLTTCISGWVMFNDKAAAIEDIYADERIPHDAYRPTFVKSLAMVPVRAEKPIAAIGAYWATRHAVTDQELHRLQLLADAASIGLTNVQLHDRLEARTQAYEDLCGKIKEETARRKENERRYRLAQRLSGVGTWEWNIATNELKWSDEVVALWGYQPEDFRGVFEEVISRIHPLDQELWKESVKNCLERGKEHRMDFRVQWPDGTIHWVSAIGNAERDVDGHAIRMVGTVMDITERKILQCEQDTAVEFLRLINKARSCRELIQDATSFFQRQSGCEAVGIRLKKGYDYPYYEAKGFSQEFVLLENSLCSHYKNGKPILDKDGVPVLDCMCGNVICGRFDPSKAFFTEKGSFWSNRTTELLATTTDADRQTRTRNRCNGEGYESVAIIALHSGEERLGLLQLNDKHCGRFTQKGILQWERLAEYLAVALSKFMAEEALHDSKHHLELALESADLGTWEWNIATDEMHFCPRWLKMLGYAEGELESDGDSWKSLINPEDREAVVEALDSHLEGVTDAYSTQHRMHHKSGEWTWVMTRGRVVERDENGLPLRMCGTQMDITEQRRLEERIRQSEKMDAIGQLAGGIAHDFNNQLAGIMGYTDLLRSRLDDEHLKPYVEKTLLAARRAGDLAKKLLTFSRQGHFEARPIDVHVIVREVTDILQHSIDKRIVIRQDLEADPATLVGDPGQIQNAILNLAINASDAMPNGGELIFATALTNLDRAYCDTIPYEINPGQYVNITITDNGCGIPKDQQKRIFEPFFTTKEVGKGTGMGLAAVYGTVKRHGGAINVYSEVGHGTTFRLYFPAQDQTTIQAEPKANTISVSGEATVLVVEDEELLRDMAAEMLSSFGYTVSVADNGESALHYYRDRWHEIDLVILDMIMPKMNGSETYRAMKKINPGVKVLLASGYSINGTAKELLDEGVQGFIQKPFHAAELSAKAAAALK